MEVAAVEAVLTGDHPALRAESAAEEQVVLGEVWPSFTLWSAKRPTLVSRYGTLGLGRRLVRCTTVSTPPVFMIRFSRLAIRDDTFGL